MCVYLYKLHDCIFNESMFHLIFLIPVDTCPQCIQRDFVFSQLPRQFTSFFILFILFVLYLTSITIPTETYSASYPRYYGEYRWQQQNCS